MACRPPSRRPGCRRSRLRRAGVAGSSPSIRAVPPARTAGRLDGGRPGHSHPACRLEGGRTRSGVDAWIGRTPLAADQAQPQGLGNHQCAEQRVEEQVAAPQPPRLGEEAPEPTRVPARRRSAAAASACPRGSRRRRRRRAAARGRGRAARRRTVPGAARPARRARCGRRRRGCGRRSPPAPRRRRARSATARARRSRAAGAAARTRPPAPRASPAG